MAKRTRRTKAEMEAAKKKAVYDPAKHDAESIIQAIINKDEEVQKHESQGLGDTIEKITEATGIKKVVKWMFGEDCGCDERKAKLNKMFPYNKPLCLTESEYEWLHTYYTEQKNTIDMKKQKEFLEIYNRVMQTKEVPTTCSDCYRDWHRRMHKIYNDYADNKSMVNNQRR